MRIYTSESVSVGHPDKLADQISDSLLDAFLALEPETHRGSTRVAIETLLTRGLAVVAGEVRTEGYVDIPLVVREAIRDTGYVHTDYGFDGKTCGVMVAIQEQSADIAAGVDSSTNAEGKIGAGDQGMMFGYATDETPELMPLPLAIAHALTAQSAKIRKEMAAAGEELMLLPDAKSQVSVEYGEDGRPIRIDTVVLSHQHTEDYREAQHEVRNLVRKRIIDPVLARFAAYDKGDVTFHINPTGVFVEGGPQGDTGVTGRKIIVDTYGGMAPHGGGAFSGKDPTKVDRSAAYAARYIAKNVVAAGLAQRCTVHLAYAIGVADPVAIHVETFGTETVAVDTIVERIRATFQLTPAGIAEMLGLLRPTAPGLSPGIKELVRTKKIAPLPTEGWNYHMTAQNGHFGNPAFPWERTDRADALKG